MKREAASVQRTGQPRCMHRLDNAMNGSLGSYGPSLGAPTFSQRTGGRSKIAEPAAKASAGSVNAAAASPPAPCTVSVIMRRRVTVSPSKAPGMLRSAVYLDFVCLRGSGTNVSSVEGGDELYRPGGL